MTETDTREKLPTAEELEREARRLARVRHLTLVQEGALPDPPVRHLYEPDPDPQAAA
jgi:hypothetical protein